MIKTAKDKNQDKAASGISPEPEADKLKRFELTYFEHLVIAGVLLAMGILAILTFYVFSAKGSLAKISVAGIPVESSMSERQIKEKIEKAARDYKITIQAHDGSKKAYRPSEAGIYILPAETATKATTTINQSAYSRLLWWRTIDIKADLKVDDSQLQTFIATHASQTDSVAKDAALSVDNGVVTLTKETRGSGFGVKNAKLSLVQATEGLRPESLKMHPAKLAPSITSGNLKSSQKKLETILAQKITFTIEGRDISPAAKDIAAWIELSPVESDKTVDVTLNSGKVLSYINSIAKPYIQPPRSRLVMKSADGSQVVLDSGANGIDVLNKDKLASEVAQSAIGGKGAKVELPVRYAAAQTVEVQPRDKWLVVDVTTKRMYAYEQTALVKSFLISAGAPKTPTVIGQFAIYSKNRSQDMRGSNADGSRYFQPDVPYVNYFYKDYAIHGNYWRPNSYFGNVNSSHGCVGITTADSAWLYDWAPIGTAVIVHK